MKSKKSSARHIAPAPPADFVVFAPEGFTSVTSSSKTRCTAIWKTIDGDVNGLVELTAAPEFLEPVAFSWRATVEVEFFDLKFRVRISGYDKVRRTLFLLGSSFLPRSCEGARTPGVLAPSHSETADDRAVTTRRNSLEVQT